jgi:ribulose-5-phosphate 4-epimerase/fuculose-1-phosphate aldolase
MYDELVVEHARQDLAAAHRLAVLDELHEGTWNHMSLAVPGRPGRLLFTPPDTHWAQVTASSLVEIGAEDAEQLRGDNTGLWVALRIHEPVHRARPDAACVIHVHSPYATALAMLEDCRLEFAEQNALDFYDRVAYSDSYDGAIGFDLGQGEAIAEWLGRTASVLFLRNHGVIVTGPTVAAAYTDAYLLERACRVQMIAAATGRPLNPVPADVAQAFAAESQSLGFRERHFAAMRRLLDETQADYQK